MFAQAQDVYIRILHLSTDIIYFASSIIKYNAIDVLEIYAECMIRFRLHDMTIGIVLNLIGCGKLY